ncbi:LAETG motif-containing sortase-dependent surface protein [Streptomyces sp. NPDC002680]|uniref:LAETG motif-containing sortase-dependent surface protein n=1 Tax=Streptomyces sp. NPDC002680 TaxID=3364659 RepID=UPI00368A6628
MACTGDKQDESLAVTISGDTKRMAPDGSWYDVTVKVENRADTAFKGVEMSLHKIAYLDGPDALLEIQEYINIQRRDAKTRTWVDVPFEDFAMTGYLPDLDLAARKTVTLDLRMSVDEDIRMPNPFPGSAYVESGFVGDGDLWPRTKRPGDDGVCLYAEGKKMDFNIYKTGTDTGEGGGTKPPSSSEPTPQAGTTAPADPSSSATTTPTGDLAHTGSSSALPVIAGVGAVAVGLGAGAVYVVRRRKSGTEVS